MKSKHTAAISLFALLIVFLLVTLKSLAEKAGQTLQSEKIEITVIVDNHPYREGLITSWGFACLVRTGEKTILFDTGGDGSTLMNNMGKLGIDFKKIDSVVLSHAHRDHIGGLTALTALHPEIKVYMPRSFPEGFKTEVRASGASVREVVSPTEIMRGVYLTGELGTNIVEQSLVLLTDRGIVLITGCAHPGIVNIIKQVKNQFANEEILMVMGGFHLIQQTGIKNIVTQFEKLGVRYVGPGHCSGKKARMIFKERYGARYVEIGVGAFISKLDQF